VIEPTTWQIEVPGALLVERPGDPPRAEVLEVIRRARVRLPQADLTLLDWLLRRLTDDASRGGRLSSFGDMHLQDHDRLIVTGRARGSASGAPPVHPDGAEQAFRFINNRNYCRLALFRHSVLP
jgi:hypothetical protein